MATTDVPVTEGSLQKGRNNLSKRAAGIKDVLRVRNGCRVRRNGVKAIGSGNHGHRRHAGKILGPIHGGGARLSGGCRARPNLTHMRLACDF